MKRLLLLMVAWTFVVHADFVQVLNQTKKKWYAKAYYECKGEITAADKRINAILPEQIADIVKPDRGFCWRASLSKNRELIFADNPDKLLPQLESLVGLMRINIGDLAGDAFYIETDPLTGRVLVKRADSQNYLQQMVSLAKEAALKGATKKIEDTLEIELNKGGTAAPERPSRGVKPIDPDDEEFD